MDGMIFNADDTIRPVATTDTGPDPRPLKGIPQ
jgi:hypothetical protein